MYQGGKNTNGPDHWSLLVFLPSCYAIKSHLHHWKVPNNLKFKNKLKIWFKPARESPLQNNTISTNVYIQSKHLVFWLINVPYITPYFFKYKNIFHHWPVVEWYLHLTVLKRILNLVTQCQLNRQRGPVICHLSAWKKYQNNIIKGDNCSCNSRSKNPKLHKTW